MLGNAYSMDTRVRFAVSPVLREIRAPVGSCEGKALSKSRKTLSDIIARFAACTPRKKLRQKLLTYAGIDC